MTMSGGGIALTFTPTAYNPRIPSHKISKPKTRASLSLQPQQAFSSDPFVLELAETLEDSVPTPLPLQKLRHTSSESLLSTPWPSRKDEPFRFTDVSFIRHSQILPVSPHPSPHSAISVDTHFPYLTIVDGHLIESMSNLPEFPKGVYVGSLSGLASTTIMEKVSELVCGFDGGDLFWSINGMGAPDLTVVYVPEGCRVENPIHLAYFSMDGGKEGSNTMRVSNPRVLVVVEKGGEVDVIEEFSATEGNRNECYWTNSAFEAVIEEGAKLRHSYIQTQSSSAAHIKWTSVRQVNHLALPIPSRRNSIAFHFLANM